MTEPAVDPDYDEQLRWRLELLKAELEEGNIHIAEHLADGFSQSLSAVRYGPDGKIDLATVDGRIRALSLAVAAKQQREDAKDAISLREISRLYFELIETNLGFLRDDARQRGLDAHEFAWGVSSSPAAIAELVPPLSGFIEAIEEFWSAVAESSHYHIQDLNGSKAVYGGDLFPSHSRNIASSVGLYTDTIVVSDPFYRTRHIFEHAPDHQKLYYLVKHAINVLSYKELALAETELPIFLLSPFQSELDEQVQDMLANTSEMDAAKHAARLFGRDFSTFQEAADFCEALDEPNTVIEALADRDRLLFDTSSDEPLEDQIRNALGMAIQEELLEGHAGRLVMLQSMSRMMQAGDILLKSKYLAGTPLIDAPTSWQYFNWKLEYNAAQDVDHMPLHMVRGLQHVANTDESWIGNIPPKALIEMRHDGALEEIRSVLARGVENIAAANPTNFFRTSDQIVDNIRNAFAEHKEKVDALRRDKIKFAGYDVGSWFVAGAIEIGAAISGTPTFGVAAVAANQVLDAPKIKEIPERYRKLRDAHIELKKSPMGLFFAHRS